MPQVDQPGYHEESAANHQYPEPKSQSQRAGGVPALVGRRARDLVLDLGLGDGAAEVVIRLDGRRHLFAEHHRFGRGVDGDLELGLLVFFDPERPASSVGHEDLIDARAPRPTAARTSRRTRQTCRL